MSAHTHGSNSPNAEAPSDKDQNDDSESGARVGEPASSSDSMGGVRTGNAKAAINREVDPPA